MSFNLLWNPCSNCACSGQPGPPCTCGTVCNGCQIPHKDLPLSWNNTIIGPGNTTLAFNGSTWQTPCINNVYYTLGCLNNAINFIAHYFTGGSCPGGTVQTCATPSQLPYTLSCTSGFNFHATSASCPNMLINGYTDWTILDPDPSNVQSRICGCVSVFSACAQLPLVGATVSIDPGGNTYTTDENGRVCFSFEGSPGNYTITASESSGRLLPQSTTIFANDCLNAGFILQPAPGYACSSCCILPLKTELTLSLDGPLVDFCGPDGPTSIPMIYDGSGIWGGCLCYDSLGFSCVVAVTFSACSIFLHFQGVPGPPQLCAVLTNVSCPPGFFGEINDPNCPISGSISE